MLFNSWIFPPFAMLVLALYRVLPHRGQNAMLLVASYVFYGWWDWRFLGLLALSTMIDYSVGRRLEYTQRDGARRALLLVSLVSNLGLLGFFKYFNFFVESANQVLAALGLQTVGGGLDIVLPVGISFYTFQTLSYTIDVYRRRITVARDLLDFALFVSFFPQLVAGPIERAAALLPQVQGRRRVTRVQLRQGAWLILAGFFKKMVVADNLAALVDPVFAQPSASAATILVALYAFAYQIYCDFSGYSDIARGLAKLMGIELMVNFDRPYKALNPSDFWRRWHISLSTWLRDYLYIPLGGNRRGATTTYRNLMLTMLLGGLWHGAAWNFVLWGAYQGLLLAAHRWTVPDRRLVTSDGPQLRFVSRVAMFHATCYGWLLFRAGSFAQIVSFTRSLAGPWGSVPLEALVSLAFFGGSLWALEVWSHNADDPLAGSTWPALGGLVCAALGLAIVLLTPPGTHSFIYFQF
jgi:alginate O-acetyltransferase complex protein AlgI